LSKIKNQSTDSGSTLRIVHIENLHNNLSQPAQPINNHKQQHNQQNNHPLNHIKEAAHKQLFTTTNTTQTNINTKIGAFGGHQKKQ
jgi:hypothetical protein